MNKQQVSSGGAVKIGDRVKHRDSMRIGRVSKLFWSEMEQEFHCRVLWDQHGGVAWVGESHLQRLELVGPA